MAACWSELLQLSARFCRANLVLATRRGKVMRVAADAVMEHASSGEFEGTGHRAISGGVAATGVVTTSADAVATDAVTARLRKRLRLLAERGGSASAARSACLHAATDLQSLGRALTVASLVTALAPALAETRGSEMLTSLAASSSSSPHSSSSSSSSLPPRRRNGPEASSLGLGPDPLRHHLTVTPVRPEPSTTHTGHGGPPSTVLAQVSLTASGPMARLLDGGSWTYSLSVEGVAEEGAAAAERVLETSAGRLAGGGVSGGDSGSSGASDRPTGGEGGTTHHLTAPLHSWHRASSSSSSSSGVDGNADLTWRLEVPIALEVRAARV